MHRWQLLQLERVIEIVGLRAIGHVRDAGLVSAQPRKKVEGGAAVSILYISRFCDATVYQVTSGESIASRSQKRVVSTVAVMALILSQSVFPGTL